MVKLKPVPITPAATQAIGADVVVLNVIAPTADITKAASSMIQPPTLRCVAPKINKYNRLPTLNTTKSTAPDPEESGLLSET